MILFAQGEIKSTECCWVDGLNSFLVLGWCRAASASSCNEVAAAIPFPLDVSRGRSTACLGLPAGVRFSSGVSNQRNSETVGHECLTELITIDLYVHEVASLRLT